MFFYRTGKWLPAVFVLLAAMVLFVGSRGRTLGGASVVIVAPSGQFSVPVELARTPAEQHQGLADRDMLDSDHGMLFFWDEDTTPIFTMGGMRFALDIIFIDRDGRIVKIAENLPPCPDRVDCVTTAPPEPIRSVLEVKAGFADRHGIAEGTATETFHVVGK